MKAALIAAIVAAIVSATAATATTSIFITGAQIKDGTIQVKDLSRKARVALKANVGPRGPVGPAGQQGPAGASGSFDWATKLTVQVGLPVSIPPGTTGRAEATCPGGGPGAGWYAISGGFQFLGAPSYGNVVRSMTMSAAKHEIDVYNTALFPITVYATVFCVSR